MARATSNLDHCLARVGRRLVLRRFLQTSTDCILIVVPTAFAIAAADWLVRFSTPGRWMQLLVLASFGGLAVGRVVLGILTQPRSRKAAARYVESQDPRFNGRLISYVDFQDSKKKPEDQTSPELIAAMCAQVEGQAQALHAKKLVPLMTKRFRVYSALLFLAAAAAAQVFLPAASRTWFTRISHPCVALDWPRRTQIVGLQPVYRLRRGDRLRLAGLIEGHLPAAVQVDLWPLATVGSEPHRTHDRVVIHEDGSFAAVLGPILERSAIRVRAGDAAAPIIPIEVAVPPCLASLKIVCHYPDFMGRPPEELPSRDVRAPVGSRIKLTLATDRPVQSIELILHESDAPRSEKILMTSDTGGTSSFILRSPGTYQVSWTDPSGLAAENPPTYRLIPIDNPRPKVTLQEPPDSLMVTPTARVPVAFEAVDDFGVTTAAIHWQAGAASGQAATQPASRTPIPLSERGPAVRQQYLWDLGQLAIRAGETMNWYLEVDDGGEHLAPSRPGLGQSPTGRLYVVDLATLLREHRSRLRAGLREIGGMAAEVAQSWDEVSALIRAVEQKNISTGEEWPRQVTLVRGRQAEMADRLGSLVGTTEKSLIEWSVSLPEEPAPRGTQLLYRILSQAVQGPMRDLLADWDRAIEQSRALPAGRGRMIRTLRGIQQRHTSLLRLLNSLSEAGEGMASRPTGSGQTQQQASGEQQDAFEQTQVMLNDRLARIVSGDPSLKKSISLHEPAPDARKPGTPTAVGSAGSATPAPGPTGLIAGGQGPQQTPMAAAGESGGRPWYWKLPPRDREILRQATAESFPPEHAVAIKRYYELLSQQAEHQP